MALDPLYFAVEDSFPHGLGLDKGECAKLTVAKDTMLKLLVQERCADGGHGATGQGKPEEWGEGVETDTRVLHVVESFLFNAALRRNFRDQPFSLGMIRFMATSLVGAEKVQ